MLGSTENAIFPHDLNNILWYYQDNFLTRSVSKNFVGYAVYLCKGGLYYKHFQAKDWLFLKCACLSETDIQTNHGAKIRWTLQHNTFLQISSILQHDRTCFCLWKLESDTRSNFITPTRHFCYAPCLYKTAAMAKRTRYNVIGESIVFMFFLNILDDYPTRD